MTGISGDTFLWLFGGWVVFAGLIAWYCSDAFQLFSWLPEKGYWTIVGEVFIYIPGRNDDKE